MASQTFWSAALSPLPLYSLGQEKMVEPMPFSPLDELVLRWTGPVDQQRRNLVRIEMVSLVFAGSDTVYHRQSWAWVAAPVHSNPKRSQSRKRSATSFSLALARRARIWVALSKVAATPTQYTLLAHRPVRSRTEFLTFFQPLPTVFSQLGPR